MTKRAGSTTKSRAIAAFALLALLQVAKNEKKVRAAGAESIVPSCLGLRTNASTRVQCTDEERQQDEAADVRCERMCSLRRRQDDETRRLFVTEHFASPRTEGGREGGKAGRELWRMFSWFVRRSSVRCMLAFLMSGSCTGLMSISRINF